MELGHFGIDVGDDLFVGVCGCAAHEVSDGFGVYSVSFGFDVGVDVVYDCVSVVGWGVGALYALAQAVLVYFADFATVAVRGCADDSVYVPRYAFDVDLGCDCDFVRS